MLLTLALCGPALAGSPAPAAASVDLPAAAQPLAPLAVELSGDPELESRAGSAALSWQLSPPSSEAQAVSYELQQAPEASFADARTLYTGPDQGRYISGMENGSYHFRVRARSGGGAWGAWSKTQTLSVEHWSAGRALGLMGLGAVLFCATAFVVLRGAPEEDLPEPKG